MCPLLVPLYVIWSMSSCYVCVPVCVRLVLVELWICLSVHLCACVHVFMCLRKIMSVVYMHGLVYMYMYMYMPQCMCTVCVHVSA